jgi:hypothetical protein
MTSSFPTSPISEVNPSSRQEEHEEKEVLKTRNSWTKVGFPFGAYHQPVCFV